MFISFEGTEGSGKSVHVAWLREWLAGRGKVVIATREPGGTPVGERVRSVILDSDLTPYPETSLLLFEAARSQLVREVIYPALESGATVISDRFADSTLAYQGYGDGLPLEQIRVLNNMATGGLTPDLTVLLDLDPAEGLRRRRGSSEWNTMDGRDLEFHCRVRDGFLALAAVEPSRWLVIDASRSLAEIRQTIVERLALWQNERGVVCDG
jgi:dTMP kinase